MKKKMKSMIAILTAIAVVGTVNYFPKNENFRVENLISVSANSSDGLFNYEIIDNEAIIVGVNDPNAYTLKIPDEMDGYPVTRIGENAFSDCKNLTSIEISKSVKDIENGMFYWCCNLTKIIVDENNSNYCDVDGVLFDKEKTVLYKFPNSQLITSYSILDTVTRIGNGAFADCSNLTNIKLPNSITSIGNSAFGGCDSLTSIEIPNSVISIGDGAFSSCASLETLEIPDSVTDIGSSAFNWCKNLNHIKLSEKITKIDEATFFGCIGLKSIEIPDSVTSIGNVAFSMCTSLETIEIPNSVTSIGNATFRECSSVAAIIIPNSVTSIGERAFGYNYDLKTENLKIYGYENSEAQNYAEKNEMEFVPIDNGYIVTTEPDTTTITPTTTTKDQTSTTISDGLEFSVGNVSGNAGDIIDIPIEMSGNTEGISGINIELLYDKDSLELLDCYSDYPAVLNGSWTASKTTGYMVFISSTGCNELGNGNVGWAEFRIKNTAEEGVYSISIGYAKYSKQIADNNQAAFAPKSLIDGSVTVTNTSYNVSNVETETAITKEPEITEVTTKANDVLDEIEFSVGNVFGNAGDEIEVPIIMNGNTDGVSGIYLELAYDMDDLELMDCFIEDSPVLVGSWTASKTTGKMVFVTGRGENEIGNGTVGLVIFRVKNTAKEGVYPISIGYAKYSKQISDNNQAAFEPESLISGSVTIKNTSYNVSDVETETVTTKEPEITGLTTNVSTKANNVLNGIEFSVGKMRGETGSEIEVPIIMNGNTEGISGINIELVYDKDSLELLDCFMADYPILSGTWMASKTTGYMVFVTGRGENEIGNGTVGLAIFRVKNTAKEGVYPISIGYAKYSKQISDNNQAAFEPESLIGGSITVRNPLLSLSDAETEAGKTLEPAITVPDTIIEPATTAPVTTAESAITIEPTITTKITSTEPAVTTKVNTTGTAVTTRVTTIPPINTSVTSVPTTQRPVVTTTTIKTEVISGNHYDVDGNVKVTALDLVKMKKQILGYETQYAQTADVNNDGKVDAKDLSAMVKYLLEN